MYTKRTFVVENSWVCSSCQTKNLGREMKCPKCGSAKEKDEKDTLAGPEAPEVTAPQLVALATQGPNWVCEFCQGQTRDEKGNCRNCAGPKPQADVKVIDLKLWEEPGWDRVKETAQKVRIEKFVSPKPLKKAPASFVIGGGVIAGLVLFVWLGFFFFGRRDVAAQVSKIDWKYTVNLRQRTLRHGSDWAPVKASAFNLRCVNGYYGTEKCRPHYCRPHSVTYSCNCVTRECNCRTTCSDNKNGFSTCTERCSRCEYCSTCSKTEYDTCYDDCPIYKDHCEYDWYDWPITDTKVNVGTSHAVEWPAVAARPEDQRLERTELYTVTFKRRDEVWSYHPSTLSEFQFFVPGSAWLVKVNRAGMVWPQKVASRQ